jgi:hypothetical protein
VSRRALLKTGLAASVTLSALPLAQPAALWGAEAGQPRRGGILRVRGSDPVHFDPHLTTNFKTHTTLSFVVTGGLKLALTQRNFYQSRLAERWKS